MAVSTFAVEVERRPVAEPVRGGERADRAAVAVGRWLEGLKRREAPALAARLVGDLPDEGSWCVLVTYRTVQLITDPASPELSKRRKVREAVLHPDGYYEELRRRGVWPVPAPGS